EAALVGKSREHAAHDDDGPQGFVVKEKFFAASAGEGDVDGREDTAFGQLAVQDKFHVAGSFKFFVDDIVHTATCIYQGGGDNCQAATFFNFTGGTKEAFGREE